MEKNLKQELKEKNKMDEENVCRVCGEIISKEEGGLCQDCEDWENLDE